MKRILNILVVLAMLLSWLSPLQAVTAAGTISVTTTLQSPGAVGDCTLGEAIQAANSDAAVDGCAAGSGADTINLPAGTYQLTAAAVTDVDYGPAGLPKITSVITIMGATDIDGNPTSIIIRPDIFGDPPATTPAFRFLHVDAGSLTLENLQFTGGEAQPNAGYWNYGGAIFTMAGAPLALNNCVLDGNQAFNGGAVYTNDALTVSGSTFSDNTAVSSGGAINSNGSLSIADSTFSGNQAEGGGAILPFYDNEAGTITGSLFVNNQATGDSVYSNGGAIYSVMDLIITNSTFTGNGAQAGGGGIMNQNGKNLTLTNVTFSGNGAYEGGHLYYQSITYYGQGFLTLKNTVLANATSGNNCRIVYSDSFVNGGGNLQYGDTSCDVPNSAPIPVGNPNLQALADNGGATQTMALGAGSAALEIGAAANCPATDQRGTTRPQPSGSTNCDAGAYESSERPALVVYPESLPGGVYGTAYSQAFSASPGTAPYSFTETGALPGGLSFNGDTLSGTPSETGASFPITIGVTDANGLTGSRDYTLAIDKATPEVALSTSPNPSAYGVSFTLTAAVSGPAGAAQPEGTLTFSKVGVETPICSDVATSAGSATCSGPTDLDSGTHTFSAAFTPNSASSINYNSATDTADHTVGASSFNISGTVFYDADANGIFDGADYPLIGEFIFLDQGCDGGDPFRTIQSGSGGSYSFLAVPANQAYCLEEQNPFGYQLTVEPAPITSLTGDVTGMDFGNITPNFTFDPTYLTYAVLNQPFNQQISVTSGGTPPYTFSFDENEYYLPPPGLTISAEGLISGAPTETGGFTFHVRAMDSEGAYVLHQYYLDIVPMVFSPERFPDGVEGVPYNETLTVIGGTAPYTFNVIFADLPDNFSYSSDGNAGTFTLESTFPTVGWYGIGIEVIDSSGLSHQSEMGFAIRTDLIFTLTSNPNPSYPDGSVTFSLAASGAVENYPPEGVVTFYADGLPISGCESVYLSARYWGQDEFQQPRDHNPALCKSSLDGAGSYNIMADFTAESGIYNSVTGISLQGNPQVIQDGVTTYSISGSVINDVDQDGILDEGEIGLDGAPVKLDWGCDGLEDDRATTLADGSFTFYNLAAGVCYNVFIADAGFVMKSSPGQIDSLSGETTLDPILAYPYFLTVSPSPVDGPLIVTLNQDYNQVITISGGVAPYSIIVYDTHLPDGLDYLTDETAGTITISGLVTELDTSEYGMRFFVVDANGTETQGDYYLRVTRPLTLTLTSLYDPVGAGQTPWFKVQASGFDPLYPPNGTVLLYNDGSQMYPYCYPYEMNASMGYQLICQAPPLDVGTYEITAEYDDYNGMYASISSSLTLEVVASYTISGMAFNDLNGDGVYDTAPTAEPGIPNQLINIDRGCDGHLDEWRIADENGQFTFDYWPGSQGDITERYCLTSDAEPGWTATLIPLEITSLTGNVAEVNFGFHQNTLWLNNNELPAGLENDFYSFTSTITGGTGPYQVTLNSGSLPDGVTLNWDATLNGGTLTISGYPTQRGVYPIQLLITDSSGTPIKETWDNEITIFGELTFNSSISSTNVGTNEPFLLSLEATDFVEGIPPWGIVAFQVNGYGIEGCSELWLGEYHEGPLDVVVNPLQCRAVFSEPGEYEISALYEGMDVTYPAAIFFVGTLLVGPTVSPVLIPNGSVGIPYSQTFTVSHFTAPLTMTPDEGYPLPAGLAYSEDEAAGTFTLSGTPTEAGYFFFSVYFSDTAGSGGSYSSDYYILTDAIYDFSASPASALLGEAVTFSLTATGTVPDPNFGVVPPVGQVTFYDGAAPIEGCADLWLTMETPTVTCTTAELAAGQHVISAEFYNVAGPYQDITLTLEGGYTVSFPLTLMPETLPVGGAGVPFSAQFSVSGDGVAPYTYALLSGDLPSGLSLSGDTLSGTPESEGIWEFTIQVTDNNAATASRAYSLEITSFPISGTVFVDLDDDGVLDPEETGRLPGTILFDQDCDDVYDGWFYTVADDGFYYSDALPAGDNYCITPEPNEDYSNQWLPSTPIPYEITNLQAEVTELNFGFRQNPLSYSPLQLPDAFVDTYYYEQVTISGGTAPYAYTEIDDSLPAGLSMSFDGSTGILTVLGTPTTAGFEGGFAGMVQDADGNQITFGMGIAVRLNVDPIFTFESNPNPSVGFEPVIFSFGALAPAAKYPDPIGVVSLFDGDLAHPIDGCQYLELYFENPVFCETTALAVGTHTILAKYQYDIYPDNQVSLTHVVSPDPSGPEITANIDGTLGSNGWYVSAVTLSWTVSDAQSPIGSQVGCDTITIEADQAKTTYTCTASSDGGTASETAIIGVDLLAPMVVLVPDRTTDINGWYNHLVHFTVEGQDDTSGTATCTPAFDYSTDDANALVTATCEDNAGNEGSETVEFQYDGTAPVVTVTAGREPDSNGWYNQAIGFTASGVDATSGNADCSLIDSYSGPDATGLTATGSCTDNAGNVGNGALTFQFDATAPVVTVTADRDPNVNGWYNAAVSFTAGGTDNLSGMDETTCTTSTYSGPDVADFTTSGSCLDYAGNEGSSSLTFNYDATAPDVTIIAARDPDVFGWYNHTIGFTASGQDATSGISQCSTIADYSGPDSADAWVTGACVDYAGNEGSQTLSFQYDGTRPVVTVTGVTEGGIYVVTNVPASGCNTTDATSGVLTEATASVSGGDADGLGDFTATCSGALDNAGNPGDTAVVHYTVVSTAFYTLKIDKTTNGGDGLEIMVGAPVTWTYVVTNVSSKNMVNVLVSDDDLGQVCKINKLAPQASKTCTKTGMAIAGPYTNTGYATVIVDGTSYTAEDDSSYFGAAPAIDVEKLVSVDLGTTWEDADSPTGPDAIVGEPVQFKFIITNAGNVDLSSITLSDTDLSLPACTTPGTLAAGSQYECVVEIPASLGQHTNTATATGEYNGLAYTDSDNANYHGRNAIEPSIAINSLTITINKARTTVSGLFAITDESQDGTAADGFLIDLTDYGIDWQVKAPKAKVYTPVIPSGGCTYSLAAVDYDQSPDWQSGDPITFDESLTIGYTCTFGSTQLPAGGTLRGTAWGYIFDLMDVEYTFVATKVIPK